MSFYQERIVAVLIKAGRSDIDPACIEGYMRLEHSTLDHLTPKRFDALARSCIRDVDADPALAAENARSFGLVRSGG